MKPRGVYVTVVAVAMAAELLAGDREPNAQPAPPTQAATAAEPAGNAQNGKRIYVKYGCYACHGRVGQGSSATGPRLGPNPIDFEAFVRFTRTPRDVMPPYTVKVVSDQELADIYAFVKSLPRPAPAARIPARQAHAPFSAMICLDLE